MIKLVPFDCKIHDIWAHAWCSDTNQLHLYERIRDFATHAIKKDSVIVGFHLETPTGFWVWSDGITHRYKK